MSRLTAIIVLLLLLGYCIYLDRSTRNEQKKYKQIAKESPELEEIMQIKSARLAPEVKRDFELTGTAIVATIVILILIVLGVFLILFLMSNNKLEENIIGLSSIMLFILLILSFTLISKNPSKKLEKVFFNNLATKYGSFEKLKKPKNIIVVGNKTKDGNIRNNYVFLYKIYKFNCLFLEYTREILIRYHSNGHVHYRYEPLNRIIEYKYNLKEIGVRLINNDIILQPRVKQVIDELSKIKIINVSIQNEYLVVAKETILYSYNSKDAERDVSDIELFYNKIIKVILECERQ